MTDICVIGAGYVGLPLAVRFAAVGRRVVCIDPDVRKIESLQRGESYIGDVTTDELAPLVEAGLLGATTDPARLAEAEAVIICVPTPLTRNREPDLSYIRVAAGSLTEHARAGQLVVLESTTYPGTTREVLLPALEARGLACGTDVFLAFSPERIDPGRTDFTVRNTPKVVGGITPACVERAVALYSAAVDTVVPVSSPEAAELSKLLENIFRSVNIALVNELAMLCDRLDIDVWEVVDAAATKPFGFMKFTPGPGLGGHCLPLDPFYLSWKAREVDFHTEFIELAGKVNQNMPYHCRELVARALNDRGQSVRGARVLMLGLAYKPNVDDTRESPALKLAELLQDQGAEISYHDPHVVSSSRLGLDSVPLDRETLASADCAVIVTAHRGVDYGLVLEHAPLVVDLRNATGPARRTNSRVRSL